MLSTRKEAEIIEHGVEEPPLGRLQSVSSIGKGSRDDNRHGVIQERSLDLVRNIDGLDMLVLSKERLL
jgi:hypothetical protein